MGAVLEEFYYIALTWHRNVVLYMQNCTAERAVSQGPVTVKVGSIPGHSIWD